MQGLIHDIFDYTAAELTATKADTGRAHRVSRLRGRGGSTTFVWFAVQQVSAYDIEVEVGCPFDGHALRDLGCGGTHAHVCHTSVWSTSNEEE